MGKLAKTVEMASLDAEMMKWEWVMWKGEGRTSGIAIVNFEDEFKNQTAGWPRLPRSTKMEGKKRMEIPCWMQFWSWKIACQCVFSSRCICSISACTSSSWLIYVATNQKNCECEGHEIPYPDHLEIPSFTLRTECVWGWPLTSSACHIMVTCRHNLPYTALKNLGSYWETRIHV